jgi:rubrerythrin
MDAFEVEATLLRNAFAVLEGEGQRCPSCGASFRVPDGEAGEHDCPACGHQPGDELAEREDEPEEDE